MNIVYNIVWSVAGYLWSGIAECYAWLAAGARVLRAAGGVRVVRGGDGEFLQRGAGLRLICPDLNPDESHRIQSHNVSLDMFVSVTPPIPPPHLVKTDRAVEGTKRTIFVFY